MGITLYELSLDFTAYCLEASTVYCIADNLAKSITY